MYMNGRMGNSGSVANHPNQINDNRKYLKDTKNLKGSMLFPDTFLDNTIKSDEKKSIPKSDKNTILLKKIYGF